MPGKELVFRVDHLNERRVLAAEIVSAAHREALARQPADAFLVQEHAAIHGAVREAARLGLEPVPATLARLSNGAVDVRYVEELVAGHPDAPAEETFRFAVEALLWDRQKHVAVTGPIDGLLKAIQAGEPPERVRGLGRAVAGCFDGWGDLRYLRDPAQVVREQVADIRERMAGRAVYPYGLPGLDCCDGDKNKRRMIPGAKPGQVTVVTGVSGAAKSTTTARIVLGLMRLKRKVLYGAWEMTGGVTLELLAILSLGWSRTALMEGRLTPEELATFEERMAALSGWVQFLDNPFRRTSGSKATNERNLDMVAGYVADAGCDVAVFDLWKRCLVSDDPSDEEQALYRQQAMAEELGVHVIMVQQQRLKDIELRPDKRPTREGIKGSGAWTEIADTILGVHRPALWKPVPDTTLEIIVLKQRYGKWPLAVEFEWDPDRGKIEGGTSIEYDVAASARAGSNPIDEMTNVREKGRGRRG